MKNIISGLKNKLKYLDIATVTLILILITICLGIIYSNILYFLFFKNYTIDNVVSFIFNPEVFSLALKNDLNVFIFIVLFSLSILEFGFFVASFLKKKNKKSKGFSFIVVFFFFNSSLVYRVSSKIYGGIDYSLPLALKDKNFWIVSLTSFTVYIVFIGLVYSIKTMVEKHAIERKEKEYRVK